MENKALLLEIRTVMEYLRSHRDFFVENPDILMDMNIPHAGLDGAVSLIERQVGMLRARNGQLERQLHELLDVARENDRLSERMHHFAQGLLEADSLDAALDGVLTRLFEEFRVEYVALRLSRPTWFTPPERPEWVAPEGLRSLLERLPQGRPRVGAEVSRAQKALLFDKNADLIQSLALLPLHVGEGSGVIALGSRDPERYSPQTGTVILSRVGELASAALSKWLKRP